MTVAGNKVVSFSLSAVARLGVPPGKWFCLARTGLGYDKYSCCVCKRHSEAFLKNWRCEFKDEEWKERMRKTVKKTLWDMQYDGSEVGMALMESRIHDFLYNGDSYLVNPAFTKLVENSSGSGLELKIITSGPRCLVDMLLPDFPPENVITDKKNIQAPSLASVSDVHIGSSTEDIRLPQTRAIVARKQESIGPLPQHITWYPALTESVLESIIGQLS